MKKEINFFCLYIFYYYYDLFFWVFKISGIIYFWIIIVDEKLVDDVLVSKLDVFFVKSFLRFSVLVEEDCEDWCLNDVESFVVLKFIEEEDEES